MAPLSVFAANDVQITNTTNFSLVTSDTAASAIVTANSGGQVTNLAITNNYIDITLDDLSNITFSSATNQYLKITKQSGSDDYTNNLTCPKTTTTLIGTGTPVILRLEVLTTNSCTAAPVSSGGNTSSSGGGTTPIPLPSNLSIKINNNAAEATSSKVILNLSGADVSNVLISNYANFAGSIWEKYTQSKNWNLLPGEGIKTVYIKFRGNGGDNPLIFSASINITTNTNNNTTTPEPTGTTNEVTPIRQPGSVQTSTTTSVILSKTCTANFNRDLKLGVIGEDVEDLQKYLNANNYLIATSGPGSIGQETNMFGRFTEIALKKFQKDNNIAGIPGVFDSATRNSLGCINYDINLSGKLKGTILLQTESHGEAWYVYPNDLKRYYLGRPNDAFQIMKKLGLGVKHTFISGNTFFPFSASGKILLDVETHGEAYYIYPKDRKAYYLGRPEDALNLMKKFGLGITNANLQKIAIGGIK